MKCALEYAKNNPNESLGPWVIFAVRNEVRKVRRRRETPLAVKEAHERSEEEDPAAAASRAELRHNLIQALSNVFPERRRTVLALKYLAGCTQEEIAQILLITVTVVKNEIHRGLEQLREILPSLGTEA
jgi:RNA polymerase sigma factor (sigma-70 family)